MTYISTMAVCINGAGKRERRFAGKVGDGVISKWLQSIGGHEATVHYNNDTGGSYSRQVVRMDYTIQERLERDEYLADRERDRY